MASTKRLLNKPVRVEWIDPTSWSAWATREVALNYQLRTNVTYGLLLECGDLVRVAQTYEEHDINEISCVFVFPRGVVKTIKEIKWK